MPVKMTKTLIRQIIDEENGAGYSSNINLQGYTFTKNGSFITFEFKYIESVKICHIKYIYFKTEKDLRTLMVNCCNFWMGNKVQFIFYKEKAKKKTAIPFLKNLNFRIERVDKPMWKYKFNCNVDAWPCKCPLYRLYK